MLFCRLLPAVPLQLAALASFKKMSQGCSSKALADDWPLNRRAIGFISRSWSFLSNRLLLNGVLSIGIPHGGAAFAKARMDIGNENDQVS